MKDESMKKQNFLQGAAILAAATLIVKLLGFLFKTPLNYIIGETGSSYFYNAYRVYDVLLMISTGPGPVIWISCRRSWSSCAGIRRSLPGSGCPSRW